MSEGNQSLEKEIHLEKFKNHNKKWLEMMEKHDVANDISNFSDDEDEENEELFGHQELDDPDFNVMLKPDGLSSSLDSVSDSNLSTPSRMGWDLNDMMESGSRMRPVSARPTTSYKRR